MALDSKGDSVKSRENALDVGSGEGLLCRLELLLLGSGETCATLNSGKDWVFTDSEEDELTPFRGSREGLSVKDWWEGLLCLSWKTGGIFLCSASE